MTTEQSTSTAWYLTTISNAGETEDGAIVDYFSAGVYYLTLTARKGDYSATTTTTLTLVDDAVPTVEILTDLADKYDPSEKIIISAEIETAEDGLFTYAEFTADTTLPYESDLSNATRGPTGLIIRQPSTTIFQMALRTNFLSAGSSYTFSLTAYYYNATTGDTQTENAVSFDVVMNSPPYSGGVGITPSFGTAFTTYFTMKATGWLDDAEDLPLYYAFSYYTLSASTSRYQGSR